MVLEWGPVTRIKVDCPCCKAVLVVESKSGLVIHSKGKKGDYSFDSALEEISERKSKADQLFSKAVEDEKQRQLTLEEKFQEALRSKDDLDEPTRLWDLD